MAIPESITEDREQSFGCDDCGGNITLFENKWACDTCGTLMSIIFTTAKVKMNEGKMKVEFRKIARQILKEIPNAEVNTVGELIRDECLKRRINYDGQIVDWAADREVNKEMYAKIRKDRKLGNDWG